MILIGFCAVAYLLTGGFLLWQRFFCSYEWNWIDLSLFIISPLTLPVFLVYVCVYHIGPYMEKRRGR